MVFEITHADREVKRRLNEKVGAPYSLFKRIKLNGVGSKRMIIEEVSPNLRSFVNTVSDISYGSIELRSKGVLIHMHKGLQRFVWAIPFYQLFLYKTPSLSIHAQGRFVLFKKNKNYKENASIIAKLFQIKEKYDQAHPHVDSIG